jgi:CheY-like chemotaxis protein
VHPGPLRILYVDDDHNDLALFGIAIDKLDLDIWLFTVLDGRQAIEYLTGSGDYADRTLHPLPDVILLDLRMSFTSGFEFLEWRRSSTFNSIPVVAFASFVSPADRQRALKLGADLCLTKPVGFEDLKECVRQIWVFARLKHGDCYSATKLCAGR